MEAAGFFKALVLSPKLHSVTWKKTTTFILVIVALQWRHLVNYENVKDPRGQEMEVITVTYLNNAYVIKNLVSYCFLQSWSLHRIKHIVLCVKLMCFKFF